MTYSKILGVLIFYNNDFDNLITFDNEILFDNEISSIEISSDNEM